MSEIILDQTHAYIDNQNQNGLVTDFTGENHPCGENHHISVPAGQLFEPYLCDPGLYMIAAQLDDEESKRIACENRLRILTCNQPDKDGINRGFGLTEQHPNVMLLSISLEADKAAEKQAIKSLEKAMKNNPLYPWLKTVKGVGEKTMARLLASIGDPYVREDGSPRTVSQLWAYCGLHVLEDVDGNHVAAKCMKGQQANWKTIAKTRLHVIEECMIKAGIRKTDTGERYAISHYGELYLDRRMHTDEIHPEWNDAHKHNDAMRIMGKQFLKELWIEAKRIHENDQI